MDKISKCELYLTVTSFKTNYKENPRICFELRKKEKSTRVKETKVILKKV